VEALDLEAIAGSYQRDAGASGLEAASVAAAAMNAAIQASLLRTAGGGGAAGAATAASTAAAEEAAKQEVRAAARRQARIGRAEAWRAARAAEEGAEGDAARAEKCAALAERTANAVASKGERLADSSAVRRAEREERISMAAARRNIGEARARICMAVGRGSRTGDRVASATGNGCDGNGAACAGSLAQDDPVLRRARALCSGASRIIAQLEKQDEALRRPAVASTTAQAPEPRQKGAVAASGTDGGTPGGVGDRRAPKLMPRSAAAAAQDEEEAQLVARARELLADYKPQKTASSPGNHGHGGVPRRARPPPCMVGGST